MTAQIPNRIHIHGAYRALLSAPENGLWDALGWRPPFVSQGSANWSGLISHWALREGKLYLTDIVGMVCRRPADEGAETSSWCRVGHFGACHEETFCLATILDLPFGGVPAVWFSGDLRVPCGELLEYVHAGWASGYERDLIVEVVAGQVVSEKIVRIPAISPPRASPRGSLWKRLWRGFQ